MLLYQCLFFKFCFNQFSSLFPVCEFFLQKCIIIINTYFYYFVGFPPANSSMMVISAPQDYTQAIQLNPHNDYTYYNRGLAYCNIGDYDAGIQDYSKACLLLRISGFQCCPDSPDNPQMSANGQLRAFRTPDFFHAISPKQYLTSFNV